MNSDLGLLSDVSKMLNIKKNNYETEKQWCFRVLYSLVGRNAYVSLWDNHNETISINHFKKRIHDLFLALSNIYPEIIGQLSEDDIKRIVEYYYELYLNTGHFYHKNNRITFSVFKSSIFSDISLIRSPHPNANVFMSGLGYYSEYYNNHDNTISSIFNFEENNLTNVIDRLISNFKFTEYKDNLTNVEYIRLSNYSRGYWKKEIEKETDLSLMRVGDVGFQIYYLYRIHNDKLYVCRLPHFIVENGQYRLISLAIMKKNNKLPKIEYKIHDGLVDVHLNYLFPIYEQLFFELYSWPSNFLSFSKFDRKMEKRVFLIFMKQMEDLGYIFEERI